MGKEIIQEHLAEARIGYPKLNDLVVENNIQKIAGTIDVIDDEGRYWDSYDVLIIIPDKYPNSLPVLIETSKKIERHIDWHIISEGICCLSTQSTMFYELKGDITLLRWLDKFAHPYLANHVYKLKTGSYANEEFSHGTLGIIEGWKQILHSNNTKQTLSLLKRMAGIESMALNQLCFCNSGKKYKRCYLLNEVAHRMNIPLYQIMNDIKTIERFI
jgi:hypothetical protein